MTDVLNYGFLGKRAVRSFYSSEMAECGLVCLAMIADYHGYDVDLNGMRRTFAVSSTGATLKTLIRFADQLGFSSRAVKVEMEALNKISLPAIIHWNMQHFVVLSEVGPSHAIIHDPAIGTRRISLETLSLNFTGVALELAPERPFIAPDSIKTKKIPLGALWSTVSGLPVTLGHIFLLSVILQSLTLAAPFQIQIVVDDAVYNSDAHLILMAGLAFAFIILLQTVAQYLRDRSILIAGSLFSYQVAANLFRLLLHLRISFFEKRHLGDILSRIQSVEPIKTMLIQQIAGATIDGLMSAVSLTILFFYSGTLTAIVLGAFALQLILTVLVYPAWRTSTQEQILAAASEQTNIMETLRGISSIKLMGAEALREAVWRNFYVKSTNASIRTDSLKIAVSAGRAALNGLLSIMVLSLGALMVIRGNGFSLGMLVAFLAFRQIFTDRINSFIDAALQFRLLNVHLDRLSDIVRADREPAAAGIGYIEPSITLKNVSFRYSIGEPEILTGCDLSIEKGDYIAITGVSGSGKSTLLKLLVGFYPVDSGKILLGGRPASDELWVQWRKQIGMVAQDDRLFSGTILENISFFDPSPDMNNVHDVARATGIHDEILSFPMRYNSLIGDMGSILSGGQRQRILLSRALYRNPQILMLDEGTANLDEGAESKIADLILSLTITRIVVAHRPALIQRANKVYSIVSGVLRPVRLV